MSAASHTAQRQIAGETGASRTTVSLMPNQVLDAHISPTTCQRVLKAARRLDSSPVPLQAPSPGRQGWV